MPRWVLLVLALAIGHGGAESGQAPGENGILVAAAASLSALAPELSVAFRNATGIHLRFNFAASNTLARQIVEGARVDVFVSADDAQMNAVEKAGRLVPGSRFNVVGNQLVVVVSASDASRSWPEGLAATNIRRVAMGDPAAVPVGVYGRRWLEKIGLWDQVAPKVVPLPTSPAALAAVREGRAEAAIVYATDARSPAALSIRVAHVIPVKDAPAIFYPAAAIRGGREAEAQKFLAFLRDRTAQSIFEAAGFRPIGGAG
jgi:molybdate transport system substrate-binding protein